MSAIDLSRFTAAHERDYAAALAEVRAGRKTSHWMWYIFPQLRGLGRSSTSHYYGIADLEEARAFLADPYLGANLAEICMALLHLRDGDAVSIFGRTDARKLRSSMTLFVAAAEHPAIFQEVLDRYLNGRPDRRTLQMLGLP